MKSKVFACFLFFTVLAYSQDVTVSETFKNTVEKIAKDAIKKKVLSYLINKDFMTGIVATDLVGQIIENYQDRNRIIASTVNTITTLIYLENLRPTVKYYLDSMEKSISLNKSFQESGLKNDDIITYSCLYYYFSERIKSKLYVSPYIYKYKDVQNKLESIRFGDSKWTVSLSGYITKQKKILFDVRLLELFQSIAKDELLNGDNTSLNIDTLINSIKHRSLRDSTFIENVSSAFDMHSTAQFLSGIVTKYIEQFQKEDSSVVNKYYSPIVTAIASPFYGFTDSNEVKDKILQCIEVLFTEWLKETDNHGLQFEWVLSLAGTVLVKDGHMVSDFTVLDQIRFSKHFGGNSIFLFLGGFIDPIIKNTVYQYGLKNYLVGIGGQYRQFYISGTAGIPYQNLSIDNFRFGGTFGYQIPIFEMFRN